MRWTPLAHARADEGLAWIALGNIQHAGNLGTLIRTAEAVGAAGFLLLDPRVDPYDHAVVRASMGGFFRQRFVRATPRLVQSWRPHGAAIVAAVAPEAGVDAPAPWEAPWPRPTVLLLGNERSGLTAEQRALATHAVTLPIVGRADSLNVATAGAIALHRLRDV